MIEIFKFITECENEAIANYYLDKAKAVIKAHTKRSDTFITENLAIYVIDLAVAYYNQRGSEGMASVSSNGISESIQTDIPEHIKRVLYSYRRLEQEEED